MYTTQDIQDLLLWEERLSEAVTVLSSNIDIMNSLADFYLRLSRNTDSGPASLCQDDIEVFSNDLGNIINNFRLQVNRSKALVKTLTDRTELVKQHRLERLNQHMESEAIVVRIVTIVTLVYLPATFTSVSQTDRMLLLFRILLTVSFSDSLQHGHNQVSGTISWRKLFTSCDEQVAGGHNSTYSADAGLGLRRQEMGRESITSREFRQWVQIILGKKILEDSLGSEISSQITVNGKAVCIVIWYLRLPKLLLPLQALSRGWSENYQHQVSFLGREL